MKGTRSLLTVFLACSWAAISLLGCSGSNQVGLSNTPGTVRLKVVASPTRSTVTTGIVPGFDFNSITDLGTTEPAVADDPSLIFDNIDLLQHIQLPATTTSTQNPVGNQLSNALITPLFSTTTLIPLMLGNTSTAGASATTIQTQVQPGTYEALRLILDQASLQAFQALSGGSLQVDPQTLTAIMPIDGGLTVRPDETVTLLMNLTSGLAQLQ